jgi:hypothetical protein
MTPPPPPPQKTKPAAAASPPDALLQAKYEGLRSRAAAGDPAAKQQVEDMARGPADSLQQHWGEQAGLAAAAAEDEEEAKKGKAQQQQQQQQQQRQ